jgi:hypothetical protein
MANDDNGGRGSKKSPKFDDVIVEWPQRSLKNCRNFPLVRDVICGKFAL